MEKAIIIITILVLVMFVVIGYNQYTLYQDNERLLLMIDQSEEVSDGYKEAYEAIKVQYDKIESYYEQEMETYIEISKRDDKVIEMMEIKLVDLQNRYDNLMDAYNKEISNK